jgi:dephospho-CoA kinase
MQLSKYMKPMESLTISCPLNTITISQTLITEVSLNKWADKYIIGLTGNIGTGKSVVRRMLEHLGAYGIDADALAHRAIARDAPGYDAVLETFGSYVLDSNQQIDRARLGRLVFGDAIALKKLEDIIHPLVLQAINLIIRRSTQKVIVIEAIKLLESDLHTYCDSIWVSTAPVETQLERLIKTRKMSEQEAQKRIEAQPSQDAKISAADVVIHNDGTFEETWQQVVKGWQSCFSDGSTQNKVLEDEPIRGEFSVLRGGPRQAGEIAELLNRLNTQKNNYTHEQIMAAFGEKAFLLLRSGNKMTGIIGWQVENLVSRTTDIYLDPALPPATALPILVREMERASNDLQSEASLIFAPKSLAKHDALWRSMGYEQRTMQSLGVLAWQDAAKESMPPDTLLLFKQLRQERILRPI